MSAAIDIITESNDDQDRKAFDFHPKVRERLEQILAIARQRFEGADVSNIATTAAAQAEVRQADIILGLPKRIFEEEKKARSGR